jgi:hypothetical protein
MPRKKMLLTKKEKEIALKSHKELIGMFHDKLDDTPEVYGHLILSHGFMGVLMKSNIEQRLGLHWNEMRSVYDEYCKLNNIPKDKVEEGWKQFLED